MLKIKNIFHKKPSRNKTKSAFRRSAWKGEKVFFEGDTYFRDLLRGISRAKQSVEFETYIFEPGHLADQVVSALMQAARRGVKVRVLVDGVGSPDFEKHYGLRLVRAGAQFRVYRSLSFLFSNLFKGFSWNALGGPFHRFHFLLNGGKHRDHRKLYIVDGTQVWMGSFNVSDWHIRKHKKKKTWRDTGISLSGVKNQAFRVAFEIAWEDPWPRLGQWKHRQMLKRWAFHDVVESPIRLTITRKLRVLYRKELLARFQSAHNRIWVLTPYFVPTHALLKALADAARRGCDVRFILPGQSDVPVVQWVSISFYRLLLKAGCRIYQYQKSVLHGKTLLVDSWALVGSSNLDYRSLRKDLEINVIPQTEKSNKALVKQYFRDLLESKEVVLTDVKGLSLRIRFLSWLFFRFRFWF